jgi:hypothetical protein
MDGLRDADEWREAFEAWVSGKRKPFAALMDGDRPIPPNFRAFLAMLFDDIDPRLANRLVLQKSKNMHRQIDTFGKKFLAGVKVLVLVDAGVPLKKAKGRIERELGKSASYIEHCMSISRPLYEKMKRGLRHSPMPTEDRGPGTGQM